MSNVTTDQKNNLEPGAVRSFRLRKPIWISVIHGRLWLTAAGNTADVWLQAGQRCLLPMGAHIVIEADVRTSYLIEADGARDKSPASTHDVSVFFLKGGGRSAFPY